MNRRKFLWTAGGAAGLAHSLHGQEEQAPKKEPQGNGEANERQPEGPVVSAPFSPVQIGTSAQLFVERSIVRDTERVWYTLHPGEKHPRNPLIKADRDWEGWRIRTYGNGIFDEDEKSFKMWYTSQSPQTYFPRPGGSLLTNYAVSKDGVEWEKPLVGTIESPKLGLRHNAVLAQEHANVIKDYAERDPSRRYKAVCGEGDKPHAKHTFTSPDGLHWSRLSTKPVVDRVGDNTNAYYDEYRRIWVLFIKKPMIARGLQRRSFCLMASEDFVNWSEPQFAFVPDYDDDAGSLGRIERARPMLGVPDDPKFMNTQFIGVGAYVAESCAVAFPWVLTVNNAGAYGGVEGIMEIQLAASRDLVKWQRHFRTPCIPRGHIGEWDSGLFYTQSKAIRHDDEIWLYYSASNFTHGDRYLQGNNEPPTSVRTQKTCSIGLVKWKLDRFVSADAGAEGGVLTTVPLTYTGSQVELNARVKRGGSIRAEFLDAAGRPIGNAGLSVPCTGDSLRSKVAWDGQAEIVDRLKGKAVSLRFHLRNAELYSFAFRSERVS